VKEESHIEEMRAALRGERERAERAKERWSKSVLAPGAEPPPEAEQAEPSPPPERGLLGRLLGR
jgi:hypothetical protein